MITMVNLSYTCIILIPKILISLQSKYKSDKMTDLQKYGGIMNEFNQKLEGTINKKYRPFLKGIINQSIQDRNKNQASQRVCLGEQIIAYKLGIQSKSIKCVQLTLSYLLRLFSHGFIDLSKQNYCEDFIITDSTIEKKRCQKYQKEMRHEILNWLQPLIHFKNQEVTSLVLKIYEYLLGEPILASLLDISQIITNQQSFSLLYSFFNYRFYLFEQVYCFKKSQIALFNYVAKNQKLNDQINFAVSRQEAYENLIERYFEEILTRITGEGGKYGVCVICSQPAEYFCKNTRASLCGMQCKKKHLEIAQKQHKNYVQSQFIYQSIKESMKVLTKKLSQKQSPFLFSLLSSIMEKPYLFQLVKAEYKNEIRNFLPAILYKAFESKNELIIQTLYFMMSSLAKWWPTQCLQQIQVFIRDHILKVLSEKRPNFRLLILVFKCLDKIFEHGRSVAELYLNLDCQINQINVIGSILFELSKIVQDRFSSTANYNKQERITIKNSCMTLFTTFAKSLNEFRRNYSQPIKVAEIMVQKLRKSNIEKFVERFNQHWSQGLKTLFNLNLVGLDSNHEIVNIIMSVAGLNKKMIDLMLFDKSCQQYLQIFLARLEEEEEPLILKLLSFYKFIPMTESNSIGLLKFVEAFEPKYKLPNFLTTIKKITNILLKTQTLESFKNKASQYITENIDSKYLYLRMLTARKIETIGKKKRAYSLCLSHSYIEPLSEQITLLQIPLSYLLQTSYDPDKIMNLVKQLIPICIHSNWVSLLIKHSGIDSINQVLLSSYNIKIIKGLLDIISIQADFIMEWLTILHFLSSLYLLLSQTHHPNKKYVIQNKIILSQQLNPIFIENTLLNASLKCSNNFGRFMRGVVTTAKEQLANQQIFMMQKIFNLLDANVQKYLVNFQQLYQQVKKFVEEIKGKGSENFIYIADMLKQLVFKVLKVNDVTDYAILKHIQLFALIMDQNSQNRQIGDYVMNCLSTVVVYHFNLKNRSWKEIIKIINAQVASYPYQTGVIVRKVLNEKMKNIEQQCENILNICLKLVKVEDQKSSIQAIHNVKLLIDIQRNLTEADLEQGYKQMDEQGEVPEIYLRQFQRFKNILVVSIEHLIEHIGGNITQAVTQTLLLLFNSKFSVQENFVLNQQQLNTFITKIFFKIQEISLTNLQKSEKILNQILFWSTKNKNKGIVKNLEYVIVNKYNPLSITSLKCIKTYIQMANLKDQQQWEDVEDTLLNIIEKSQVQRFFTQYWFTEAIQNIIREIKENTLASRISYDIDVDIDKFVHECRVQMLAVQLLPNHKKCLRTLQKAYKLKVQFNDNLLIRILLWIKGLGREYPPDLLAIQQTISNRIMATHIWQNNPRQILKYCYQILGKFIQSSHLYEYIKNSEFEIRSKSNQQNCQIFELLVNYWNKRRSPLSKLICYIIPKLGRYCQKKQERKQLLKLLVQIIPYMQNKEIVLKIICQLSQKKYNPD